jgi:formylglycine-generating enzyme required for sulfatase activity
VASPTRPEDSRASALCDFRLQAASDSGNSGLRPLRDYLERFPGFEEDVAREYLAFLEEQNPRARPDDADTAQRYSRVAEIGRGGMGVVERVHDAQLDRDLALKLLRRDGPRARRRFQEEARITSLLDHPGVVPVHESGVDADGTPFFTMRLVEGLDFEDVIARVHAGDREWTMPRALEALVKVCDTMAFAHARGIVHRDLKPSNVRVGRYGEVYVMDWGLAHEMASEDLHEIRPRSAGVDVVRGDEREDGLAVVTLEGDVLGTPAYMPPEQANGEIAAVGPHSDVYSVGAMLHHLLVGRRPYSEHSDARRSRDVLELVRAGAPESAQRLRPNAPRELVAICTKAMQRDPRERYADMRGFASDLRAFLDGRVVSAHRSGPWARAQKWVARNRVLSAVVGVALVGGTAALVMIALGRIESRQRLVQLSGGQLKVDFDTLWPPHPASVPVLERWLADTRSYLASRDENARILREMEGRALPIDPDRPAERRAVAEMRDFIHQRKSLIDHFREIDENYDSGARGPEGTDRTWVRAQIRGNEVALQADEARPLEHKTFEFADPDDQRLYDAVRRVLAEQAEFETTTTQAGLLGLAELGLEASRRVEHDSIVAHADRWLTAIRSIADVAECPAYKGLQITPQLGLVPIGRDPDSGLWEFWHVLSGEEPLHDERGVVVPDEAMGIVLVLLPGGSVERGSQAEDPNKPNYDLWAEANAPWQSAVALSPFFLSKFETTQAQWMRISRTNPSSNNADGAMLGLLRPVERITFAEARRVLRVAGLTLPTEAQWEYGARAGTGTPWFTGCEPDSILGAANFADRSYARSPGSVPSHYVGGIDLDDGWVGSAPVGSYAPNAFGLFDTMGNVREWCADRGPFGYGDSKTRMFTGERIYESDGTKAVRGGSFFEAPTCSRSAAREQSAEGQRRPDLGVRAARPVEE